MKGPAFLRLFGVLGALLCGCGDDGPKADDGDADTDADTDADSDGDGLPFGSPCAADAECAEGACVGDACTRECDEYDDCPDAARCAAVEGGRVVCVPNAFGDGIGQNCTFEGCPEGLYCYSRGIDDPNAFCSDVCDSDAQCPEGFVCTTTFSDPTPHCREPAFCDPCAIDDDCGIGGRCLADDDDVRYCSVVCTLDVATCPAGATCVAQAKGDPACEPAAGVCGPTGELCSTCENDDDCDAGGVCLMDRFAGGIFCGSPCSLNADCPNEHYCNANAERVGGGLAPEPQCYPRTGDCGDPSRGGTMCFPCEGLGDCYNGYCHAVGFTRFCGESCAENGEADCPPFSVCEEFTLGSGETVYDCVPENANPCYLWQQCLEESGAGECAEGAPCISGHCNGE